MKKLLFCITALAFGASLFAEGKKLLISDLNEGVEIHSGTDSPSDSDEGSVPISPSRSTTLKTGQYLDIVYPGTGWIYLGEMEGSSLLRYEKREIGDGDTFFTLQARKTGTTILHFYKSDALAGNYIDDYLSVSISGTSRNGEHVEAPSYADIVPPRPSFQQSAAVAQALQERSNVETESSSESIQYVPSQDIQETDSSFVSQADSGDSEDDKSATVIQTNSSSAVSESTASTAEARPQAASETNETDSDSSKKADTSNLSEKEILDLAQKAFEAKNYTESLSYLEDFFDKAVSLTDEGLYLKGKVLETPSSSRNIKEALSSYKAIVNNYPESELWDDASKRISYIERIYFDIR